MQRGGEEGILGLAIVHIQTAKVKTLCCLIFYSLENFLFEIKFMSLLMKGFMRTQSGVKGEFVSA